MATSSLNSSGVRSSVGLPPRSELRGAEVPVAQRQIQVGLVFHVGQPRLTDRTVVGGMHMIEQRRRPGDDPSFPTSCSE